MKRRPEKQPITLSFVKLTSIALMAILLLNGCNNDPTLSEEDKVRATIAAIEVAAESRSLSGMMEHVSDSYRDFEGNDAKRVKGVLQLQLIKNQNINIFSKIRELEVVEKTATVELSVAMASREVDLALEQNRLKADTHRFSILLKLEQKDWKVQSVSWQRGW